MNNIEITLLTEGQVWGNENEEQLEVLKKYGTRSAISDLVILTGGYCEDTCIHMAPDDDTLKGRVGWTYTQSSDVDGDVRGVHKDGSRSYKYRYKRNGAVRPALLSSSVLSQIYPNRVRGYNDTEEVEYGEYPQYAPDENTQRRLESEYQNRRLSLTGRNYTFDSTLYDNHSQEFQSVTYDEYEYRGSKYIRVEANSSYKNISFQLSNGERYRNGDYVWVEVSPVKWLIDDKTKMLVSKIGLLSGIRFHTDKYKYNGDFKTTDMKEYFDKYMIKDLFQNETLVKNQEQIIIKEKKLQKQNPYSFNFEKLTEEDIIKGAIESNISVFLHGRSSEGKSARVKQIDPDCTIIYLRNTTPDSLNGKSVYNSKTNEMIDIKPSWLVKLEEKCLNESDKLHILFFDELTNALPSIQGMAFNIVLDKEVNGKWKLPDNVRIVAAGNELDDSLSANKLAEPLFNRFAHVYIKTTAENWLNWANENNIHPAIYAYISYKGEEVLRSKYNGETPNADPRKWEMASNMLYKNNNPEMLRALIGEELTKDFIRFCSQKVITLEDVINENYTENDLNMNISEKYATVLGLTFATEEHFFIVRDFISKLGNEYVSIFESMWHHNDENRLEIIAESKLINKKVRVKKK